ncbi:cysteine desulfurase [Candidatus Saccharibacteria bacterium]|nr:cysteine desulfurase [Candidatus Saccharibacteria bacterium]
MIYLDHSATSPILPSAKKAMENALENFPGNASALHTPGHLAHNLIEEARENIAKLINADPEEIIFTSGGSEANNTVIHTFKNCEIFASAIEHPSILEPAKTYAKKLHQIPVDKDGVINLDFLKKSLKNTAKNTLCSVMLANNELGTIEPITEVKSIISALKSSDNIYLHTDATQALGKIKIDVKKLDIAYLTASAHKIGGPVGIGILYVKKGAPYQPLILGGHQEHGKRAGTYNTVAIAGFGAVAKYATTHKTWETYESEVRPLRDKLANLILKNIKGSALNTPLSLSLPNILNVSFAAAEGESIQLYLDMLGKIIVSTGSACASGDGKPSHVIMATRNDAEVAHSSIRFSLGLNTKKSDIDAVMKELPNIIKNLQGISTIEVKND